MFRELYANSGVSDKKENKQLNLIAGLICNVLGTGTSVGLIGQNQFLFSMCLDSCCCIMMCLRGCQIYSFMLKVNRDEINMFEEEKVNTLIIQQTLHCPMVQVPSKSILGIY